MADIVLGRVFRLARIQQFPHAVFHCQRVHALADNVVLVEDVAEEVAVVKFVDDVAFHLLGQLFYPVAVVAAQRDIQGDDVLDRAAMRVAVADGCPGDGKAV